MDSNDKSRLIKISKTLINIDKSLKEIINCCGLNQNQELIVDDCSRCWCATCIYRQNCKLKPDEVMSGIFGPPCNGCRKGQRFMPIGKNLCKYYKERKS